MNRAIRTWAAPLWPLAVILVVAAALRLSMLGQFSFWFDEVYVANLTTYNRALPDVWTYITERDAHPPLYYTLMWAWAWITGLHGSAFPIPPLHTEWTLRLPSALLGIWNVALTAALAGRVAGPANARHAALSAGALAACSGLLIAQDQQARMLTLLTTLTLLGTLTLDELLRRPTKTRAVSLGLLWTAALYTQYLAPFLIAAQLLWAALRPTEARRVPWLWVLAPLLLFLPWMPMFLKQLAAGAAHPEARVPLPLALSRGAQMLTGGIWPPPVPRLYWGPYQVPTTPTAITILLGTLSTLTLLLSGCRAPGRAFLLAMPLGFMALWLAVSVTLVNTFDTWYLGPLAALLCAALRCLGGRRRERSGHVERVVGCPARPEQARAGLTPGVAADRAAARGVRRASAHRPGVAPGPLERRPHGPPATEPAGRRPGVLEPGEHVHVRLLPGGPPGQARSGHTHAAAATRAGRRARVADSRVHLLHPRTEGKSAHRPTGTAGNGPGDNNPERPESSADANAPATQTTRSLSGHASGSESHRMRTARSEGGAPNPGACASHVR